MANAIVRAEWKDGNAVCIALAVDESLAQDGIAFHEYIGCVEMDAAFLAMTAAEKRTTLINAAKLKREEFKPRIGPAASPAFTTTAQKSVTV